jgi:regulator of protease activity HflC (stomatin/prohibitin superfamily)
VAARMSLRVTELMIKLETKTKDNVFVTVEVSVQYEVKPDKVFDAFYQLSNAERQIRAYVYDVVRSQVPKLLLDDVFTTKEELADAVKEQLEHVMAAFGYTIVQTLITDITPDIKVKDAMNEINAAQRLREAALDKAEAEKILIVKGAEAEAQSKYLAGQGIARQRTAIIEGLRDSVLEFTDIIDGTDPKDVMDLVLITQYFDTLKEVGANCNTVFLPGSSRDAPPGDDLRQAILSANAAKIGYSGPGLIEIPSR